MSKEINFKAVQKAFKIPGFRAMSLLRLSMLLISHILDSTAFLHFEEKHTNQIFQQKKRRRQRFTFVVVVCSMSLLFEVLFPIK